jgi:Uncharacterised nucleotidyltransferase
MTGSIPEIDLLLVQLVGKATVAVSDLRALDLQTWQALSERAADHRIQPLLHVEWGSGPLADAIPQAVRDDWAQAHRIAAMRALAHKAELARVTGLLKDQGMATLALKGSWLAWHAYPAPAMRPMRDIDLLVADNQAEQAWHFLRKQGFEIIETLIEPVEAWARQYRHLPALLSPQGILIELHNQLWDNSPLNPPDLPGLFERARSESGDDLIRYPGFVDMLAHLVIHAAHGHRFDCGPQVMADIDMLVRRAGFDWPGVWQTAATQGWAKAAALVLAVTDRWCRPGLLAESQCPVAVPGQLVSAIPGLMCKPFKQPGDLLVKLTRSDVTPLEKLRRVKDMREHYPDLASYLAWLGRQIGQTTLALLPGSGRQRVSELTRLDAWLRP